VSYAKKNLLGAAKAADPKDAAGHRFGKTPGLGSTKDAGTKLGAKDKTGTKKDPGKGKGGITKDGTTTETVTKGSIKKPGRMKAF
jgi:hypothetical protein